MKILFKTLAACTAALVAVTLSGSAQSLKMSPVGETQTEWGTTVYVMPSTTLVVDVTVRRETVKTGEYARFAQRYLGVIAPLADKDVHHVLSAGIKWTDSDAYQVSYIEDLPEPRTRTVSHVEPDGDFMRVLPDRMSSSVKNAEDAARDAANMIYNIRKRRVELVMGDIGENVYGEGLRAALERMDKIENDYLELFLGKQTVETYTVRFYVTPEKGRNSYVVCRMNESKGILPVSDLSGEPLMLELRPEGAVSSAYAAMSSGQKKNAKNQPAGDWQVAETVTCRLTDGKTDYVSETVPIYQMGVRVSR